MKNFIMAVAILLSILNPTAYADEASKKVITEELLQAMKVDRMTKAISDQIWAMMKQQFSRSGASDDMMPIFKKYSDKISDVLEKYLSWQVIKDDCVSIYMQTYTETELKGMLTFYKSPVGQSVTDKMPMVIQRSMSIIQKHKPEMHEEIEKISEEMVQEIKTEMEKKKGLHDDKSVLQGIGDTIIPPNFSNNPQPVYPAIARLKGMEGTVMLTVLVSREGTVLKIEIAHSSRYAILDKAAITAVRNWRFVPAKLGDSPIDQWVQVPVAFHLARIS
ncbi:MAG: TonB family protein [Smithella sp.]